MDPYVEVAAARRLSILDHTSLTCAARNHLEEGKEEEKVDGKLLAVDIATQDLSCVIGRQ